VISDYDFYFKKSFKELDTINDFILNISKMNFMPLYD